ncbi:MAG: sigma-70 family RNA polymerase sigma factor [Chloroflexota bacterium]|nr:sigma-70 family RNA polymerase sigma factor [Chloroflexota bacterium]
MTRASHDGAETASRREITRIVREHAGHLAAALVRVTGDFATAEDLVQDAVMAALQRWPTEGIPERPDGWLFTVARNRGLDALRRESNYRTKLAQIRWPVQPESDERLRLIFTCCHPALPREAQIALTLRVVCSLTTAQIARAFLVPETTVAQRITRAKRKIIEAGIPYRVPDPDELNARLRQVLAVIYLLLNEGYLSTVDQTESRDLVDDAEWLACQLYELMPTEPEVAGLLALIQLHRARAEARFDRDGDLLLLEHQNRSSWNHRAIADATRLLRRAAEQHRPGPYQLQAAIVACHAEASNWGDTDWEQIVLLYDMLLHLAPSPLTRLHRSIALRYSAGPHAALIEVDALSETLDHYHLYHATRAELLRALGHPYQARAADQRALELTTNPAEQALLRRRIDPDGVECERPAGPMAKPPGHEFTDVEAAVAGTAMAALTGFWTQALDAYQQVVDRTAWSS